MHVSGGDFGNKKHSLDGISVEGGFNEVRFLSLYISHTHTHALSFLLSLTHTNTQILSVSLLLSHTHTKLAADTADPR